TASGLSLPPGDLDIVEPEDAAVPLGSGVLGRRTEAPSGDVHPGGLPREAHHDAVFRPLRVAALELELLLVVAAGHREDGLLAALVPLVEREAVLGADVDVGEVRRARHFPRAEAVMELDTQRAGAGVRHPVHDRGARPEPPLARPFLERTIGQA